MHNINPSNSKLQALYSLEDKVSLEFLLAWMPLSIVLRNRGQFMLNMPGCVTKTLNYLFRLRNGHLNLYPTQTTIGEVIGYARESVNKAIAWLTSLRIIRKTYKHMHACDYQIAPLFFDTVWRKRLSVVFPALLFSFFPSTFCHNVKRDPEANVTRIYKGFIKEVDILTNSSNYSTTYPDLFNFYGNNPPPTIQNPPHFTDELGTSAHDTPFTRGGLCGEGGFVCGECKNEKRLRKFMKQTPAQEIPNHVESIKVLTLTLKGKIQLSAFSQEAIQFAQNQMNKPGILDPFRYFHGICRKYSQEHNAPIDYELVNRLMRYHNLEEGQPNLEPGTGINRIKAKKPVDPKDKSSVNYPIWQSPKDMFEFDSLEAKVAYLIKEATVVHEAKTCAPCKEAKIFCEQARNNPYASALRDLSKEKSSQDGYIANDIAWHVRQSLNNIFNSVKCVVVPKKEEQI